jgi:ADP-ribose pyrophosphatase YjhB (NUDIX family)
MDDAHQDTGFNAKDFALISQEDKLSATAVKGLFLCNRCGAAPPIPVYSDHSRPPRLVRELCSPVEYRHSGMIVRCIAEHRGGILLCQRADEPRRGFWNTPGGFLESGETPRTAVIRETLEEAGVSVSGLKLGFIHEFPQLDQIVMTFLAEIQEPSITAGKESLDARFFQIESIPWRHLAFPTDRDALHRTFRYSAHRQSRLQAIECFCATDGRIFARER